MPLLVWILLFTALGGVLSALLAALVLRIRPERRLQMLPHLLSFAVGAMLGAAWLAVLPHALESGTNPHRIGWTVLLGLLAFFLLEKLVLWRHCHSGHCEAHAPGPVADGQAAGSGRAAGTLILFGDGIHNLIDGVLIAGAFLVDVELGIITSLAIAAHEVPQEVGDFAILLNSGFSPMRALVLNVLSGCTAIVGGILGYLAFSQAEMMLPYLLALAAASFLYVAVADLMPGLHRKMSLMETLQQLLCIAVGVIVVASAHAHLH